MSGPLRILVVIATYNELANLPRLVAEIRRQLPTAEVLVVDDRSPDGTGNWCREESARWEGLHLIERDGKLGLGSATVRGLQFAIDQQFDFVVVMDADFSHDPSYLPALVAAASDPHQPADIAIGSRYVPGGGVRGWPWRRRWMSRLINGYARWWLRLPVRDCSGAFRCFRVEFLRQIALADLRSPGFALLEELLWVLQRAGARFREVPITFVDRTHGQSKISFREAWQAVWTITRLGCRS